MSTETWSGLEVPNGRWWVGGLVGLDLGKGAVLVPSPPAVQGENRSITVGLAIGRRCTAAPSANWTPLGSFREIPYAVFGEIGALFVINIYHRDLKRDLNPTPPFWC